MTIKRDNQKSYLSKDSTLNEDLRPQTVSNKRKVKFAFGADISNNSPILLSNELESSSKVNEESVEENENLKFIQMYYEDCFNPYKYLDQPREQQKRSALMNAKNMLFLLGKEREEGFTNKYQISLNESKKFVLSKRYGKTRNNITNQQNGISTQEEVDSYLKGNTSEFFQNILNTTWFKDSDDFLKSRKAMYVKHSLGISNSPNVYDRMSADVRRRTLK